MDTTLWSHVLRLMGLVIVADRRVYQEEVETFVSQSLILQGLLSPDMIFSKKMAFDWFVAHRSELNEIVEMPDYKKQVLKHILSLGEFPNLQPILNAIWTISASDGEHHQSEVNIAALAATYWDLPVPKEQK